jgi:hypothetical protein
METRDCGMIKILFSRPAKFNQTFNACVLMVIIYFWIVYCCDSCFVLLWPFRLSLYDWSYQSKNPSHNPLPWQFWPRKRLQKATCFDPENSHQIAPIWHPRLGEIEYVVRSPKFIWAPCSQLFSLAETPQPSPTPRIWAHIRGRYWSAKIDDISYVVTLWWKSTNDREKNYEKNGSVRMPQQQAF